MDSLVDNVLIKAIHDGGFYSFENSEERVKSHGIFICELALQKHLIVFSVIE